MKAPDRLTVGAWGLALALGGAGGWLFTKIGTPLPWMLGAIFFNLAAAMAGLRPKVPNPLRLGMVAVLGVMLGSAFTPDIVDHLGDWVVSMAGLFVYVIVATSAVILFFRRVVKFGPVTSYFSAAPGGLTEMIMVGTAMGGDERAISLVHSIRILITVFTLPFLYQLFVGYERPEGGLPPADAFLTGTDLGLLAASAILGAGVARLFHLPAFFLTGPMLGSAVVHLAELTAAHPPPVVVAVAQVVIGASIGSRFVGVPLKSMRDTFFAALGSTSIILVVAAVFSVAVQAMTGIPFSSLILAFSPGGVAEMSLIAISLGRDVAFVSTHHLVRIMLVVMMAPLVFSLLRNALAPPGTPEAPGGGSGAGGGGEGSGGRA
ncbi:AbrB family transcriptional regulator [Caenispirillum bisanense]|uniref:AbrB family transcriptional regulator n=1 Tax=Caenispirillum bisanense TaxID=414052 RepID=UPI0031E46A47